MELFNAEADAPVNTEELEDLKRKDLASTEAALEKVNELVKKQQLWADDAHVADMDKDGWASLVQVCLGSLRIAP